MSALDRHLDTFGRQLTRTRPPAPRRALALGGTGAIATAAIAATLLLSGGPAPVDALAAARAALTVQQDELVAIRVRVDMPGQSATVEQWSTESPRRWRSVRVINGNRMEAAFADGAQSWLTGDTLRVQTGVREDINLATLPVPLGFDGRSADTSIRDLLAQGALTDQGEVESGGRTVRRLVGDGVVYDVDPATFVPLQGSIDIPGVSLKFTVERYEKLPLDAETAKLLTITPPPGTKTIVQTSEEARGEPGRKRR